MTLHSRDGELANRLKPAVRVLRIIVGAMSLGILGFACVVVTVRMARAPEPGEMQKLLTPLAIGAALVAVVASRVVPALVVNRSRRQIAAGKFTQSQNTSPDGPLADVAELGDTGKLFSVYQTHTIVAAALLEGAAFLNLVATMLSGSVVTLAVAIMLAMLILAMFPSAQRVAGWIDEQRRLIDDEKLLVR